ncbi:MAG: glutamate--tRNA ligase [Nitrososphaeraceae archaeon]|nr:glutamate--tRNA ligase [Nitrososphaeraceae archaeon]
MEFDDELYNKIKFIILKNSLDYEKARIETVLSKLISSNPNLRTDIKRIIPYLNKEIDKINSLRKEDKIELLKKMDQNYGVSKDKKNIKDGFTLPPLINAENGHVVTRFPPEPNGYPHIGHAKAAIIDEEYARHYNGKFILRFDDTNPLNEQSEYYDVILEDLNWLKIKPDIIKNTSDDITLLHKYGQELIKNNSGYICTCKPETIHKLRSSGIECECRLNSTNSLEKMDKFFNGYFHKNEAIVRFKGDMKNDNTAIRDPTLFRIIDTEHPRLGRKNVIWPTYDFAAPIEDSLDGVTHALRTKEYELRNQLYREILTALNLRIPEVLEFSRLEFEGMPVSKRKIKPLIVNKQIHSWDDPRLPTLKAFKKRGFTPEAIRKFVLSLGLTLSETKPSIEVLESFNRKIIDREAIRLFFVRDPWEITLENSTIKEILLQNHPSLEMGRRIIVVKDSVYISSVDAKNLTKGSEIRLIEFSNIIINEIDREKKELKCKITNNIINKDIPKIQWVSTENSVPYKIVKPHMLFINDDFNPNSLEIITGYAESFVSTLLTDTMVQFIREGFCRIENNNTSIFAHK